VITFIRQCFGEGFSATDKTNSKMQGNSLTDLSNYQKQVAVTMSPGFTGSVGSKRKGVRRQNVILCGIS